MKVWITKYALTQGIYEIEAERCINVDENMISDINTKGMLYHGEGREWHILKENAIKKAEKMKLDKISSLKKQIIKLENMKFK